MLKCSIRREKGTVLWIVSIIFVVSCHLSSPLTHSLHNQDTFYLFCYLEYSYLHSHTVTDEGRPKSPRQDMKLAQNHSGLFCLLSKANLFFSLVFFLVLSSTASRGQWIQNHKLPSGVGWGEHHSGCHTVEDIWKTTPDFVNHSLQILSYSKSCPNPHSFSNSLIHFAGKEEQCFQRMLLWEPETL